MVMNPSQVNLTNFLVVALFRHELFVVAVGLFVALGMVLIAGALVSGRIRTFNLSAAGLAEPRSRSFLRYSFGLIWLVDGILQFQPSMPLGLANSVIAPTMAGAPGWLRALMTHAITLWNDHPIHFAVGAAWIQLGIGLALLFSNGGLSRWIGGVSAGWAGLIWLVGNGAGGIFMPGSSILFGWPGATVFYVIAGCWLVVRPEVFAQRFSSVTLRLLAVIIGIGALRQLLPSLGFWQGGNKNALTAMTQTMTQTAQPHWVAWIASHGGSVAGTLGGGSNLIVVLWLLVSAVGLWLAPTRGWDWPVWSLVTFGLVFWVVAEDAAFWGGVATDFNSLIPLAALTAVAAPRFQVAAPLARRLPQELRSLSAGVGAAFAVAMVLYSVALMGWSTFQPTETTFFVAANGQASGVDNPAPRFTLTDQHGKSFTLDAHPGRYTLLTFLDPACWTDCPLLAAQLKATRSAFSANAPLDLVAVAANPARESLAEVRHFIAQHNLGGVPHFSFVTGPLPAMQKVWKSWGMSVENVKGSAMSVHSDYFFIIDPHGNVRWVIPDDPLNGQSTTQRSDVAEVVSLLQQSGLH